MKSLFILLLVCCFWCLPASTALAQECDPSLVYVFPSSNWVCPPGIQWIHLLSHCSEGTGSYLTVWYPRARRPSNFNFSAQNSGAAPGWGIWFTGADWTHLGEYTKLYIYQDGQLIPDAPTGFTVEEGAPPLELTVVHGIVRSDLGTPLAGVQVTVVEQGGATHSMNTRSDGSYAIQWANGDSVQVWIEPPAGYDCVDPVGCSVDLVPPYVEEWHFRHRVVDFTLTGAMAVEPATWGGTKSQYR